jgi:hypothetical protein
MDAILATIIAGRQAQIQLNVEVDKIILMSHQFNQCLGQCMHKAAHPQAAWIHQIMPLEGQTALSSWW